MDKNKITDLNHLSFLEINGEGAFDLLQGQITCDVNKVDSNNSCLGALCNAKGRIISSFILCLLEKGSYGLIGHHKTLKKTEEELQKYSPFYEVEINENLSFSFFGINKETFENTYNKKIVYPDNTIEIGGSTFISYLGKKFLLAFCDKEGLSEFENLFELDANRIDWKLDEILCQNVEISEENSGKYTPHELNYDVNNRIDFEKGCYTGQEVVARMHYRGKNLPRLNLAETPDLNITENMTLTDQEDKKIGKLVKVVNLDKKSVCLVSAKEKNYVGGPFKIRETNSVLSIN
ncbi:MAG: YgfZ/GcvT domain-containing protein [SAR86 cluster bacterium]|jgi:hypothetical protein